MIYMGDDEFNLIFYMKLVFLSFLLIWVRGTLPRYRFDKLIYLCWKRYLPFTFNKKIQGIQFYPLNQILFWSIITTIILLTWIGARSVEAPYIITGQLLTLIYFSYFILNPILNKFWDNLIFKY